MSVGRGKRIQRKDPKPAALNQLHILDFGGFFFFFLVRLRISKSVDIAQKMFVSLETST